MTLTRDRVLELLDVDLLTGAVVWKRPTSIRVKAGQRAAPKVGIDGKRYPLEHIRHLVRNGDMPKGGEAYGACEPGWKVVPGFSGAYEVSQLGEVRSRSRAVGQANGVVRFWPAKLLKPKRQRKNHYLCVTLRDATSARLVYATVHSLVAGAFLPDKPDGAVVRHKDGNPSNNRFDNLEWGTAAENMRDQYLHGTRIASEWHPHARLSVDQVRDIRASSETGAEIARRLGLSVSTICRARKAKTYAVLSRDQLPDLLAGQ